MSAATAVQSAPYRAWFADQITRCLDAVECMLGDERLTAGARSDLSYLHSQLTGMLLGQRTDSDLLDLIEGHERYGIAVQAKIDIERWRRTGAP